MDVKVTGPDGRDPEDKRNVRVGCAAVAVIFLFIPAVIIAIPLVASLYRWAFGG